MFEELGVIYRGLIIGIMIAAPVGPIGLLCMRRTIRQGPVVGFSTGLGAAFADAFFAALAAFGIAQVTDWVHNYNSAIHLVGGGFLFAVALHTWFDPPHPLKKAVTIGVGSTLKALASGFIITITNPVTIFGTLAVVATFGSLRNKWEALTLVGSIFIGSNAWWLTLSGIVALFRHHFSEKTVLWINRITAIGLAAIAFWAVWAGAMAFLTPGSVDNTSFLPIKLP